MGIKDIGIYVHIPFCVQKCFYCDFISFANKKEIIKNYIEALKKEIEYVGASIMSAQNSEITTIYIGGGTPSFVDSKYIVEIIDTIKSNFRINKGAEITIEINPGTVTKEKLEDYTKCGINRASIGLQSTDNKLLKQIGRIHTYEQFLNTYEIVRNVGFKNVNVDLMLALPNQTIEILEDSLKKVIAIKPEHISVYSLILEEGTKLYDLVENEGIRLVDEETERKMYWKVKNILEQNGYNHYEISNFAKNGFESKHNLNCWKQKEYLGMGTAAHSYYNKTRYSNTDNLEEYIENISEGKNTKIVHETQKETDEQKEYMLLGLRKIEGVSISKFKEKFVQNPIYIFRKELNILVEQELVEVDIDSIKLTNKGLDLANLVWEEFV
ncbi:MAG: oxygen-independent coproporphyrinogen III oxidase [Clostridia bacterium]|nr:oxygen-independent coproporphyrinogen III oxidase [Clostridia bacterium]